MAVDHLIGRLDGSTDDKDLAWLVDPTGRRVAVVWPEGFSVQFSPDVALFNEQRILVAQRGTVIEMTQVGRNDHSGTDEDPYLATGLLFGGCYQLKRGT